MRQRVKMKDSDEDMTQQDKYDVTEKTKRDLETIHYKPLKVLLFSILSLTLMTFSVFFEIPLLPQNF